MKLNPLLKSNSIKSQSKTANNCVVISQPMYFPWIGILEQIRLCNTFVYYDDVQFSKGSFFNRVQVKTSTGMRWLTVPLRNFKLGQQINEVEIDYRTNWQRSHIDILRQAYVKAAYKAEMLKIVEDVILQKYVSLAELSSASMLSLVSYFGLENGRTFINSSDLISSGSSTQRVIDICVRLKGTLYVTGHGARNYLKHEAFEAEGIKVNYIDYGLNSYNQQHGPFSPHVTSLDLIANCGKGGIDYITYNLVPWRKFINYKEQ